jgi:hypothetical protein
MHPTIYFQKKPDILISVTSFFRKCSVGLIFTPLGSLSLVKYTVLYIGSQFFQLLGRAYRSTLWLAIVLGVNPFLNTIETEQQKFMIESYFRNGHTVHTFRESDSVQRKPGNLRFVLKKILTLFNVKWKTTANYLSGNCCSTLS